MIIGTPESRFVRDILRKKLAQEAELNGEDFCKWIINNLCEANLKILALRLFPLALGSSSGEAVNQLVNFLGVFKDYLEFVRHFSTIWKGEYANSEILFDYFVDDVVIEMDPPTSFQIGGDVRGERSRVEVKLSDPIEILDFYAPPRA